MKQICSDAKGNLFLEEVPPPSVKKNGVLVETAYSLISSGTESMAISGGGSLLKKVKQKPELVKTVIKSVQTQGLDKTINLVKDRVNELRPLGYCCSGIVIEVAANVTDIKVGDRVACGGGGYAAHSEINFVPKNLLVKVPDNVNLEEAAFTTIGSIGMQGLRRANVSLGETVVVIGLGLIGQLVCQMLKVAGCRVLGVDLVQDKIDLALRNGLDKGKIWLENDISRDVNYFTSGIGADAVILCAGTSSSDPVNLAFKIAREKGKIIILGAVGMDLERDTFYHKEQDFLISRSYGPGRYDQGYEEQGIDYPVSYVRWTENRNMQEFVQLLSEKKLNIESLISKRYKINDALTAYQNIGQNLGVLIDYGPGDKNYNIKTSKKIEVNVISAKIDSKIKVGIIGGGAFAKQYHLPNINKLKDFELRAIATQTGANGKTIANRYKMNYCTTDYSEILKDEKIDLVVISTRHNLHKQISVDAVKAGKNVFLEKPLALTKKDCLEIKDAVESSNVLFTIGFNRRYSPFSEKAKQLMTKIDEPKMLSYRVNAGVLPKNHWLNDPDEGGGRLLGEACHFLDLLYWFIEAESTSISAVKIQSDSTEITDNDNFSCLIKYSDGSTGTLIYSSIGDQSFSKERVEIFSGGKVIVIEDFRELILSGFQSTGFRKKRIDKGHYNQWKNFLSCLKGEKELDLTVYDGIRVFNESMEIMKQLNEVK